MTEIVQQVISDQSNRYVSVTTDDDLKKKKAPKKKASKPAADPLVGQPCPLCGQGTVIKGKTAYGCSRWKEGCTWRQPFKQ